MTATAEGSSNGASESITATEEVRGPSVVELRPRSTSAPAPPLLVEGLPLKEGDEAGPIAGEEEDEDAGAEAAEDGATGTVVRATRVRGGVEERKNSGLVHSKREGFSTRNTFASACGRA